MPKIKICGLRRLEDIYAVNEYKPDYIGFVFAGKKRFVSPELAQELKDRLDKSIKAVGVFVNADTEFISHLVEDGTIDIVQLHGDEDNAYIDKLRARVSVPVIKAVRVRNAEDAAEGERISCDYPLFDTYSASEYGGTGRLFDWSVLSDVKKPFFLAGGLNLDNISAAAKTVRPYCLDISSGVETDGFKDREKIARVIEIVRSV